MPRWMRMASSHAFETAASKLGPVHHLLPPRTQLTEWLAATTAAGVRCCVQSLVKKSRASELGGCSRVRATVSLGTFWLGDARQTMTELHDAATDASSGSMSVCRM